MPTEVISIGPAFSMVQNVVYALPALRVLLFTVGAPTLFQANDLAMTTPVAVTLAGGQAELAGKFLQCTSTGPQVVTLKRA